MISDEELTKIKEKIELEEKFRWEIIKAQPQPSKFWLFLNSSFGLWLLSAIFISGFGSLYNHWNKELGSEKVKLEQKLKLEAKHKEIVEKLDAEISYRLSTSFSQLDSISHAIKFKKYPQNISVNDFAVNASFSIVKKMSNYPPKDFPPLHQEYQISSLPMLISDLHTRTNSKEKKEELSKVLKSLLDISRRLDFNGDIPYQVEAAHLINETILIPRWRSQPFKYLDCKAEKPLC